MQGKSERPISIYVVINITTIMEDVLRMLGCTELEMRIYTMLLNEGASWTGNISQKTGIHRRNVYDALERLIQKGLVRYIQENNRKIYSVTSPNRIHEQLQQATKDYEEELPMLVKKYAALSERKETVFYRGLNGLRLVFQDQIREGKEVLVVATNVRISDILRHYLPKYHILRRESKIRTRMLFDATDSKDPEHVRKLKQLPLCQVRWLPNLNKSPTSQYIYGNNVAIVVWSHDPIAILIRQKDVADAFRANFEVMWEIAKSETKKNLKIQSSSRRNGRPVNGPGGRRQHRNSKHNTRHARRKRPSRARIP
jgi:sugar-specific transcriptional regulator TrmB